MNCIEELEQRGLLHDVTSREGVLALSSKDSFYVGIDPTAPSLQIGNLLPLIVVAHLAKAGPRPIIVIGGSTGSIGDPSGKSQERQLLSQEVLKANGDRQRAKIEEILARVNVKPTFVNNLDWTRDVRILDFLRDIGKHFTVNYMIAKEVVKTRLDGEGISFTEFSYMLLQSFDYLHLYQEHDCRLQIGGSDQWGNITAGLELIRKKISGEAYALSWPLLTKSDGTKYGKSEGGSVWLDKEHFSPYKLHQFFLNTEDSEVIKLIKCFTFLPLAEIKEIEKKFKADPSSRSAQKILADEVCSLVHGEAATKDAVKSAEVLFGGSLDGVSEAELSDIFSDVPSKDIERASLLSLPLIDLLVASGAVKSKGEARRLIDGGGAYIHGERIQDGTKLVKDTHVATRNLIVLRTGKKSFCLVKAT